MTMAETMKTKLETALASNVGVVQITIDGQTIRFDRKQALQEYRFWCRIYNREQGNKPLAAAVNLSGF